MKACPAQGKRHIIRTWHGYIVVVFTFGYRQSLHGRELMASGGVRDLQGADGLVAGDDLPVGG